MLKEGDPVTILASKHPDIAIGAQGVVDCVRGDGYGVRITGRFGIGKEARDKDQTVITWFPFNAVELTTEANPT